MYTGKRLSLYNKVVSSIFKYIYLFLFPLKRLWQLHSRYVRHKPGESVTLFYNRFRDLLFLINPAL